MADHGGNVVTERFTAQRPVGVGRSAMRLQMDRDHLPVPGQLSQVAAEAIGGYATVKKDERLAGAMHAVEDVLVVDVGKVGVRHRGWLPGFERKGSQSALRSLRRSSGNRV
jgi:hypothetical protein